MKYLDYAAFGAASGAYGAASSAYAEASRARAEVAALWEEIQRLSDDINSQKYERDFQRWAEELIYQFNKTVTAISESPGHPLNDCADLVSFFQVIEQNKLNTALISGLENKKEFEQTLLKAQNLLTRLETTPLVQDCIRQQEAVRLEQELLHGADGVRLMAEYGITYDGKQYVYKEYRNDKFDGRPYIYAVYRYDKLSFAIDYAKKQRL